MSLKSIGAQIFASIINRKTQKWSNQPVATQEKVFKNLIKRAQNTAFGKAHDFVDITSHINFIEKVPVRDYEQLRPFVDRVVAGESDILWPGKPLYYAKTSGTTSGAKYIPITKDSMPEHVKAARNAILSYIHETGKTAFVNDKMIFLQGSPEMTDKNGVQLGRLSGIVAHYVPGYLQKNRMPSWETNCIDDWETKVEVIIDETLPENMGIISGIPSWVQMYFERIVKRTGKKVGDIFPDFNLFIYGGVNFEPYKPKFEQLIGSPVEHFYEENAPRLTIGEVEIGVNYVLIISTTAGLWAYNIGDTVAFTSTNPYRVIVTGRIKHYISASGEHVIGKEVELAMKEAATIHNIIINEFTVAPQLTPHENQLPFHEWFIEFGETPENLEAFKSTLDLKMREQNSYYDDLIVGKVLQPLVIKEVSQGGFKEYMKTIGKLGGQNKLPRLSNDRKIAKVLEKIIKDS